MAKFLTQRLIFIALLFIIRPFTGLGNDGSSSVNGFRKLSGVHKMATISDTIPDTKKPEESAPPAEVKPGKIKEVPKSRRQVKPIPVPNLPVKPLKIIKPKIIKRTIGIIG